MIVSISVILSTVASSPSSVTACLALCSRVIQFWHPVPSIFMFSVLVAIGNKKMIEKMCMLCYCFFVYGIQDFCAIFSRCDESIIFQDFQMMRHEILWHIEVLPDVAHAVFTVFE